MHPDIREDVLRVRPYVEQIVEHFVHNDDTHERFGQHNTRTHIRPETLEWLSTILAEAGDHTPLAERFIYADTAVTDRQAQRYGRAILLHATERMHIVHRAKTSHPSAGIGTSAS